MKGSVADFDDSRGLGTIAGDDGALYPFHCTAISDGSRTIPVGQRVSFDVRAAVLGRWEATAIESTGSGVASGA